MCSMIDSGERGYKLPEQILFNSLVLHLTLCCHCVCVCACFIHVIDVIDYLLVS